MSLSPSELEALLAAPALAPPEGVVPNFDHPDNRNTLAVFVFTFCTIVATLCLLLRVYARFWVERKLQLEELLMIGAYGAYIGTTYVSYEMIKTPGYFVHTWNLRNGDLVRPLWLILLYGSCYSVVLPMIKTAILLDWCRLFVPSSRSKNVFWWACMSVSVFQSLWGVLCIILLNMQCVPHNAIWEFYVPSKCYSLPKVMLTSACVQVVTDFLMVALPQKIIWDLHMNWQKKLGVSVIFGVGVLACVAACFRLDHTITFAGSADTMYFIGPLLFWACAEMTAGFFIFCVPCVPKLIKESPLPRRIKEMLGLSIKSTTGKSNQNTVSGSHQLSKAGMSSEAYVQIGEDGITMADMEKSESQERLREASATRDGKPINGVQVTRTTHITVTSDSHSGSDLELGDTAAPWDNAAK
ncbi:Rhodopsin domain-containing protein [Madurella fahalii]|uniref:Rhodopsin domain-containing protein n=1 Tax=Madurella fahalii TaxID=1157608 RepID=A0ABQ0GN98_9PEZI